jgi:thiamine-phosphate pyrophosphorylase
VGLPCSPILPREGWQTSGVTSSHSGAARRDRLARARLYFVCDAAPGGRDLPEVLDAALRGGVDLFQLRDKRLSDDDLLAAAQVAREACGRANALFLLNDRPDLALAAGADGVHVGQEDMPVDEAREIVGAERIVGLSTHTVAQVDAATGGDYIAVGPVHATPTKPGRPAVGVELVRHAARNATLPFFAIGGLNVANVHEVVGAGATRIVVVRAIAEAADPERAARELCAALPAREHQEATVGSA